MRRSIVLMFCGAVVLVCCATNPNPNANLNPTREVSEVRADILSRDVAWIMDTVPVLRFNRLSIYPQWRAVVETCSGLTREGWPTFYIAPISPLGYLPDGRARAALYAERSQSIVFGLGYNIFPWAVMHELLHFLSAPHIAPAPKNESAEDMIARTHPDSLFGASGKCGAFVNPPPS